MKGSRKGVNREERKKEGQKEVRMKENLGGEGSTVKIK